jgi:hypothetical protein
MPTDRRTQPTWRLGTGELLAFDRSWHECEVLGQLGKCRARPRTGISAPLCCKAICVHWLRATTAAIGKFYANKSSAFTCCIIGNYANGAPMQQRGAFLMRGLAFIASRRSAFVKSPPQYWALDGKWARLQKSLCARVDGACTIAFCASSRVVEKYPSTPRARRGYPNVEGLRKRPWGLS